MPLFGSQRDRNKRLFDSVYVAFAQATSQMDWQREQKDAQISWYVGATTAANLAVNDCDALTKAWGKGDQRRSAFLTTVFTMPTIVRFYRWSAGTRELGLVRRLDFIEPALRNILHAYRDLPFPPDETLQEYLDIAKQFEFEQDAWEEDRKKGGRRGMWHWIEMDYLLSKALLALGEESSFSLGEVKLPVASMREFIQRGGVPGVDLNDIGSYMAMFEAVHRGAAVAGTVMKELSNLQESDN